MMLTAKEFWNNACKNETLKSPADIMIEFAKLHCTEQAKVISENAKIKSWFKSNNKNSRYKEWRDEESINLFETTQKYTVDKDSILNAYNLNNIK